MAVINSLGITFFSVVQTVLSFYQYVVIAAIVISWINPRPDSPFMIQLIQMIVRMTEPVFQKVRSFLPRALFQTGIDFTPMIVLLGLYAIQVFLSSLAFQMINMSRL
jgi:YggT family protein